QELDNARSARAAAEATARAQQAADDQARLSLSWRRVVAPISGIAGLAAKHVGDLVGPQTIRTTISTVDPIRVLYEVSEQEYLQFRGGASAYQNDLELVLADGTLFPRKGRIALSGRDV